MSSSALPRALPHVVKPGADRIVGYWLLICCLLVFAMVVIGGVTRLTGSGLSMVRWEPLSGVLPPMNAAEWQAEFEHYQTSPEYQKINVGMDVEGFKSIYWLEYFHRLLGRLVGLVFFLPFLYFFFAGYLRPSMVPRLIGLFVLGGLQGLLGWYMVKSGLVDNPRVSPYRLTAHLGLAVLIYVYMMWIALSLLVSPRRRRASHTRSAVGISLILTIAIAVTMLSGGFVAGLKAGHAFNSFPLMAGEFVPPGYLALSPAYLNLFENIGAVQFNHRWLAMLTFVGVLAFVLGAGNNTVLADHRPALRALLVVAVAQVVLGVATLLLHVPIALAAAHQGTAMLLLTVAVYLLFRAQQTERSI